MPVERCNLGCRFDEERTGAELQSSAPGPANDTDDGPRGDAGDGEHGRELEQPGQVAAKNVIASGLADECEVQLSVPFAAAPPPARHQRKPAASALATSAAVPPTPVDQLPESAPSAVLLSPPTEKRAPFASRPADSLAEEVAILSHASAELHAGRPAAALKALDEHRRKFPRGALAQERTSARSAR
jgi:hypothetical protein